VSELAALIADLLTRDASALAARWRAQARFVVPGAVDRPAELGAPPGAADRAAVLSPSAGPNAAGAPHLRDGERLVRAVADALRGGPMAHEALMEAGWDAGWSAHGAGLSVHDLLKQLDLLAAMVLYAGKLAALGPAGPDATGAAHDGAAAGIEAARRVQRTFSLLTLAAARGFTQAHVTRVDGELRGLRHDLRNPLSTIENVLTLMDDERVAPELRNNARFRGMLVRNARSLGALISERLSDVSALAPELGRREVSLHDIALSVRRDLREEADAQECAVVVGDELPEALVDPAGFELALKSAVTAALHAAPPRSAIAVELREQRDRSAVVAVACEPPAGEPLAAAPPPNFARRLLERAGVRVWVEGDGVYFEVPTSAAHAAHDVAGAS
jgi:signal transduction histidine kinase